MPKSNEILRGNCFYCKKVQYLEWKTFLRGEQSWICPVCNASNSKMRLRKEIKEGKAKVIS
jgi:transposase-like protein